MICCFESAAVWVSSERNEAMFPHDPQHRNGAVLWERVRIGMQWGKRPSARDRMIRTVAAVGVDGHFVYSHSDRRYSLYSVH